MAIKQQILLYTCVNNSRHVFTVCKCESEKENSRMYIYVDEQVHMDDVNSLLVYVVCCVRRSKHKEPS